MVEAVRRRWRLAFEAAWADDWQECGSGGARGANQAICILGLAGSGKTFLVSTVIQEAMSANARVIVACPTRILVASYRARMPGLDADSIHSALQVFRPEQQTLDLMAQFELVVVEEVGQLSVDVF